MWRCGPRVYEFERVQTEVVDEGNCFDKGRKVTVDLK